jgi:hypothetical protein
MGLREFTDRSGSRWRVWDIRPEQMHAATRAEDHLQNVMTGWLAFEPAAGGEKRRLAPIPGNWETANDDELDEMLARAESARADWAGSPARPASAASPHPAQPGAGSGQPGIRTFRYPTGRYWTVNELPVPQSTEQARPLLRFTSGARSLDTAEWPAGWMRMSDVDLADLLYRSFPRDDSAPNATEYRRRRGDSA